MGLWLWGDWGVGLRFGFNLPDQPEEAFGCGVLAGLELVADEVLEGVGLEGSGELAVGDFLSRRDHVNLVVPSIVLFRSSVALRPSLP